MRVAIAAAVHLGRERARRQARDLHSCAARWKGAHERGRERTGTASGGAVAWTHLVADGSRTCSTAVRKRCEYSALRTRSRVGSLAASSGSRPSMLAKSPVWYTCVRQIL